MKNTKYAFCLVHFGDKIKYLEYEIYTILMLKNNTKNDIIYLYSVNDTPKSFVKIIKSLNVITKKYDDLNITYNIKKYNSVYSHFNLLRTCNYLFAFKLIKYEKICIIESDMIFMHNLDNIFDLKCPSIMFYDINYNDANKNKLINISNDKLLDMSLTQSPVNGGVLLFEPSLFYFQKSITSIKKIIDKNYPYPGESLFVYIMEKLYTLPIIYNLSHYRVNKFIDMKNKISIYHFDYSIYKPLDYIKDN
jgi:hypothetical protein